MALTSWIQQREERVRTQDIEKKGPSEGHLLPGYDRGRDKSGYRNKETK